MTRRFTALNGAALVVGAVAGLAAVGFRLLISLIENGSFLGVLEASPREHNEFIRTVWGAWVFLVPFAGGLIVGAIRFLWPETRQQGVAEVMAAVQARGGILRARTSWGHAIISAVTVGTGGSTGREGPISYIGAAIGSSAARRLGFRPRDIKILLGCGFSAGIGATFNAPLGGALLAIELILPEFSTHAFIPLVAATVIGVTVAHAFLGDSPTFLIPEFEFNSPWELLIYLVLGIVTGLGAVMFIRVMASTTRAWQTFAMPDWVKPAFGGLIIGLLGLAMFEVFGQYHIFGTGYATVSGILAGDPFLLYVPLLLTLLFLKPLATSITIGSGGGGGVFSVSMYQGALYGGLVGLAANAFFPATAAHPGAYALVGMGAFYAASARATLTSIVILAELTNDYTIVLPLMFAAVTADAVSVGLSRDSIYTARLAQKGILFDHDRVASPLDFMQVKEVMSTNVDSLPGTITVGEAFNKMLDLGHTGYPVIDAEGKLAGIITRRDLSKHLHGGKGGEQLQDVVAGLCITAFPDEMLHRARDRIYQQDIGRLVVVDPADRRRIVGILTRSDLLKAEAQRDVEHEDSFEGDFRRGAN